jgi:hypothetical protein
MLNKGEARRSPENGRSSKRRHDQKQSQSSASAAAAQFCGNLNELLATTATISNTGISWVDDNNNNNNYEGWRRGKAATAKGRPTAAAGKRAPGRPGPAADFGAGKLQNGRSRV